MVKKLASAFSRFHPIKALLVGDYMLDRYTTGTVERISPEAPVPVLRVEKKESRPGGAGNVVLNLLSLGAHVTAFGRIGQDEEGEDLKKCLQDAGADTSSLIIQKGYQTPIKNRLIGDGQQIIRVDTETISNLPESYEEALINKLDFLIKEMQVVAISDYGKGFLTKTFIAKVIACANNHNIPVIVDPKGIDFSKYKGATIIKPNLMEAYAAAKVSKRESLETVADILLKETQADMLLITRSQEGISLFEKDNKRSDFSVRYKEVKDVTGAGDTVLATISVALANGLKISDAAQLANITAGIAIEHIGCARITLSDLGRRLLELDIENKIFEESHLYVLEQVLKGKRTSVLALDSSIGITTSVFRSILLLASNKEEELLLYIKNPDPDEEFITLLSSLSEVDFIILHNENLKNFYETIEPHKIYEMHNDEMIVHDKPKEILKSLIGVCKTV